jgi:hypothetical protein
MGDLIKGSMPPAEIGERVAAAIEAGDLYIFTHPETREWLDRRHAAIDAAFDKAVAADARGVAAAAE